MITSELEQDIRGMLDRKIEVYYVKNPEINERREEEKRKFIDWIIEQVKEPIFDGGTLQDTPDTCFGESWDQISTAVRMRDGNRCKICGGEQMEVHHIRPRYLRGKNHPRNLVCLCTKCHDEVHRRIESGICDAIARSLTSDGDI